MFIKMKFEKLILLLLLVSFCVTNSQSFIYIGSKKYKATDTWKFKSQNDFGTKDNPELTIAKNGKVGYAMISTYVGENTNKLNGDLYIFLENGLQIKCVDRNIKDFVDNSSVAIYKLSENEMKDLSSHLISKIRYTVNYGSRGDYSSTALNKIPSILPYKNEDTLDYYLTNTEVNNLFKKDYGGEYTSDKTIFKNELSPEQNFTESTSFNLAVAFKSNNDGMIIIQDPRMPDSPLLYKITGFKEEFETKGNHISIYNCINQITQSKNEAVFFKNENGLKLMISNEDNMQIWLNLKLKYNE